MIKIWQHKYLLLVGIAVIAAVIRLWHIGSVPPSPNWDEAALGYNAYSILHTGKDEYGTVLPVVLKSFGDYKPALYTYLIIPFIPFFDLSVLAVRLPSAIFGIIAVVATYFLVLELFAKQSTKQHLSWRSPETIALLSAFLLAISPWHIQFSRVGFEANVALTFVILTVLFFLKGLQNGRLLIPAAVCAVLSTYTYQSEKVFIPLLVLALVIIYRQQLLALPRKYIIYTVAIGVIVLLPLLGFMATHKESLARAQMTSVISRGDKILERSAKRLQIDKKNGDVLGQLFNNRRVVYAKTIINGYIVHFDPKWLFITGDLPRHHAPGMGLLYLWELPFLLIGIVALLSNKDKKAKTLIFSWFLLAPVPAAITFDVPHAVRTLNFLPMFQIFIALGLVTAASYIANSKYQIVKIQIKYVIFTLFFSFFIFNFLYYINQYFVQQNYYYAKDWQYGYKQAVSDVAKMKGEYEHIVIASDVPMDQSYIFFLFYLKYPPDKYQKEAIYFNGSVDHAFDMYTFRPIHWDKEEKLNTLFVGSSKDFPDSIKTLKTISYPDGTPAIKIVSGNDTSLAVRM